MKRPKDFFLRLATHVKALMLADLMPVCRYTKSKSQCQTCIATIRKACLPRISRSLLHLRKKIHESTQTCFWQLESLAQHQIMVLDHFNIMQEYSSRISPLRNPHWLIRSFHLYLQIPLKKIHICFNFCFFSLT